MKEIHSYKHVVWRHLRSFKRIKYTSGHSLSNKLLLLSRFRVFENWVQILRLVFMFQWAALTFTFFYASATQKNIHKRSFLRFSRRLKYILKFRHFWSSTVLVKKVLIKECNCLPIYIADTYSYVQLQILSRNDFLHIFVMYGIRIQCQT